ncbi:MAG TPA: ABC transporter ATP-binding protein [Actinomycetota bacterium]|nr:ABC transporter ATP-binding protein [Actinomycetota bacterium]
MSLLPRTAVVDRLGGVAITAREVRHTYTTDGGRLQVLHDLDLDVDAGGYLALTGPSGAGKSTFLSLLGGLEPLQEGRIDVGDRELATLRGDELAAYRRRTVGFVFQHYGLVEVLSALENVELALALTGLGRGQRRQRALQLLEGVGIADRAGHRPTSLSGGERQRVAIARAMANRPRLLLADEPTGNLDEDIAGHVLDLLESLRAEQGCTLLVVTHNPRVASRADARRRLVAGRWVEP